MGSRDMTGGAAIYARFSSDLQNPRSIRDQVDRLRGEIVKRGEAVNDSLIFSDAETSRAVWDRPGLQALLRAVADGHVRSIFIEDVSRISRDKADLAQLEKQLAFRGVRLIAAADGIELDGSPGASLAFGVKSLISEVYLKDLGDKTRRGLQGNAREGKSTGGRTYGYTTNPDATIEIDELQAATVRRIFELYTAGSGYARIAAILNQDGIEPPRGTRRRGGATVGGWIASCIREMLRNPKYIGAWSFGVREWRRHPDTRRRVARKRGDASVLRIDRPELAIVDRDLWDAVQARLVEHAQAYKSRAVPHRRTDYLLSGLLRCATCGGLLQISGGTPHRYYRCVANRKRGAATCANSLSVRETVARDRILGAIRDALSTPEAVAYIRKRISERLGAIAREVDTELAEREARLARVEERIRGIIVMQAEGDRSPMVAEMRRDFEAQAATERAAVAELRARTEAPIRLPNVGDIAARVQGLDALAEPGNVDAARDALRRYLKGGAITCSAEGGRYVARAELLPLVMLDGPDMGNPAGLEAGRGCPRLVARGRYAGSTTP